MGCQGAKGLGWKMHGTTTTNGHTAKYASPSLGWYMLSIVPCSYLCLVHTYQRTKMMIAIHYLFWYIALFLERIFSSDGFTGNYFGIVTGILAFHITQVLTQSTSVVFMFDLFSISFCKLVYILYSCYMRIRIHVYCLLYFLLHGVYQSNGECICLEPNDTIQYSNTPIIGNFELLHTILCNNQYWYSSWVYYCLNPNLIF